MKYFIFYPSNITGGAEYLLFETAFILARKGFQVVVIDIPNGWLSNKLKKSLSNIEIIFYDGTNKINLSEGVLITPALMARNISKYFRKVESVTVLLWIMAPYNVIRKLSMLKKINHIKAIRFAEDVILFFDRRRTCNFLKDCVIKKGIYAVDSECFDFFEKTYHFKPNGIMPIILPDRKFKEFTSFMKPKSSKLNILWIGRIDLDFKYFSLKKLIDDFSLVGKHKLTIIGDGEGYEKIKNYTTSKDIFWMGTLDENQISDIILSSNLGFAMGTSALEMASKGLPTVLMDYSFSEIHNYKYRFLSSVKGYCVANEVSRIEDMNANRFNFNDIIKFILTDSERIGYECYSYVNKMYRSSIIDNEIISRIQETELLLSDCIDYSESI